MKGFRWTRKAKLAAELVAADDLTDPQIAEQVGISLSTLARLKRVPEFEARRAEHVEAIRSAALGRAIAIRERRVEWLSDRARRMRRLIEERAADPAQQDVPGWQTGLLVHTVKGVGRGEDFQLVDLYEVDTGLLREMREHERQAAQELGQWTDKQTIGGDPNNPMVIKMLRDVTMDELP